MTSQRKEVSSVAPGVPETCVPFSVQSVAFVDREPVRRLQSSDSSFPVTLPVASGGGRLLWCSEVMGSILSLVFGGF